MSVVTLPRVQIPLTSGGERVSAEWYRWFHDATIRLGGVTGMGTTELAAMLSALDGQVKDSDVIARAAGGAVLSRVRDLETVEVPADMLRSLLSRVAMLERKVLRIEEAPL